MLAGEGRHGYAVYDGEIAVVWPSTVRLSKCVPLVELAMRRIRCLLIGSTFTSGRRPVWQSPIPSMEGPCVMDAPISSNQPPQAYLTRGV